MAFAVGLIEPTDEEVDWPVTVTLALPVTVRLVLRAEVIARPVTLTLTGAVTAGDPKPELIP